VQDHGFMLNRSIEDPDGYIREIMWMDAAAQRWLPADESTAEFSRGLDAGQRSRNFSLLSNPARACHIE
jgi:hypothetical protein